MKRRFECTVLISWCHLDSCSFLCHCEECNDGVVNKTQDKILILDQPCIVIWTASSEFVSSSIPSWQILTVHAQPFRGARDLAFCLKVLLDSLLVWASSEGSGEMRMRRLAWTFAARIGYKYQIRLMRSIGRQIHNLCHVLRVFK